jgi:hypothetical protein
MVGEKYLRLADMENLRQTPAKASVAFSRLLSTFESAGLAATATFAGVLWIGLALPGLPLLPGVGGGQNSNVAISLSSAVLGVQDSRTFGSSIGTAGRQARLLSLLLPAPDPLGNDLATKQPDTEAQSGASMVVALPPPLPEQAPTHDAGPRVIESTHLASAASAPAPPAPAPPPPRPTVSSPTPPRQPDPKPQTPATPTLPIDPPPPADPDPSPVAGDTPPSDGSSPDTTTTPTTPDPGGAPADGNGNGNGNSDGSSGGNDPNAGGGNPNAGGANAGGNGNGNGNAGGNNPNAGGNNPNAGGANAGGTGNGTGAPKGPNKGH